MRLLVKVPIPSNAENPVIGNPGFEEELRRVFLGIGAQAIYSQIVDGKRVEYALVDIADIARINSLAEPIFRFLGVKSELLPEMTPKPYYGRSGY